MKAEGMFSDAMLRLQLVVVLESDRVSLYRLEEPGTRIGSCEICFTDEGIGIFGDLCPNDNRGCHSAYGYGVEWFSGNVSGGYLCSKFLSLEYHREHGLGHVRQLIEYAHDYELSFEQLSKLREVSERDIESFHDFVDLMVEIDRYDDVTDGAGLGYDSVSADLLIAIQKRFSELYKEHRKMVAS